MCLNEKLALLQTHCAELCVQSLLWSLCDQGCVKGLLLHYSLVVLLLCSSVTQVQCLMGPQAKGVHCDWSRPSPFAL
jgi:hypothetical protein